MNDPGGFDDRRGVAAQMQRSGERMAVLQAELTQTLTDLSVLELRITSVGGLVGTYLIVPYTSLTGYCACYTAKQAQLAPIIAAANTEQATVLPPLFAQVGAVMNQVTGMVSSGALLNVGKIIGTLTFVGAIAAFVLFGIKFASFVLLVGLLLFAVYLLFLVAQVVTAQIRIAASRSRIVRWHLQYYRLQEISTCQRVLLPPPPGVAPPLPPSMLEENAWWRTIVEEVEPPSPPKEED